MKIVPFNVLSLTQIIKPAFMDYVTFPVISHLKIHCFNLRVRVGEHVYLIVL